MWHKTFGKVPATLSAGGGGKILLTTRCSFLQRKVMTAGMTEGQKNAVQHPVWEKVAPLPATAQLTLGAIKWVTGPRQPTHLCPWAISIYLHSGLAPGMKKQQLFPWRRGQRRQEEVGKAMAASASSLHVWAMAEHHQEPHEWEAAAAPWFN